MIIMQKGHAFHVSDSECTLVDNDFKPFLKITLKTLKVWALHNLYFTCILLNACQNLSHFSLFCEHFGKSLIMLS